MRRLKRAAAMLSLVAMIAAAYPAQTMGAEYAPVREQVTKDVQPVEESPAIHFAVIDSAYIESPGVQSAAVDIVNDGGRIQNAVLQYVNKNTGKTLQAKAAQRTENTFLFQMEYPSQEGTGIYALESVTYEGEQGRETLSFAAQGLDIRYGVNQEIQVSEPNMVLEDKTLGEEALEERTLEEEIGEALEIAQSTLGKSRGAALPSAAANKGQTVIVLDPGHGGTDCGATRVINGVRYYERDIVLKIAKYCKAELEKYAAVKVYLTRTDNTSPLMDRQQRCTFAQSKGATAVVSLHINATGTETTTASGALVYSPNGDTKSGALSRELADEILKKLEELGLMNRGKLVDESLGMVYYPKQMGFPGILVEHAFINNQDDVSGYLNTDAKLKKLGIADAKGIAKYYGLKIAVAKPGTSEIIQVMSQNSKELSVSWGTVPGAAGYQLYRGETQDGNFEKIADIIQDTTTEIAELAEYRDKEIKTGKSYFYKVRVLNQKSGQTAYSDFSETMSGKTVAAAVPTGIQSKGDNSLEITWKKVSGATGYQIQRSTSETKGFKRIATIPSGAATTYLDKKAEAGTTYYYRVQSMNLQNEVEGYSGYGAVISGQTIAHTTIKNVKSVPGNGLQITWAKREGASRYRIYRSETPKGTYKQIGQVSAKETKFTDKGISLNKNYHYKVRVYRKVNGKDGYSSDSASVYGRAVGKTKITKIQVKGKRQVTLSWKKTEGAASYDVYRKTGTSGTYTKIAAIKNGAALTYTDKKTKAGKTYYYAVRCNNKVNGVAGNGSRSAGKKISIPKGE